MTVNEITTKTMTIDMLKGNKNIQKFIDKVNAHLYTEEESQLIQEELYDHIFSLTYDYMDAGHSFETAVHKALLQMGDPSEIGYSFTDYSAMKKRRYTLLGLKALSILILIITLGIPIVHLAILDLDESSSTETLEATEKTDDLYNGNIPHDFNVFLATTFTSLSDLFFWFAYTCFLLSLLRLDHFAFYGLTLSRLKISKEPLFVLWGYKQKFPWEYLIGGVFLLPLLLLLIFATANAGGNVLFFIAGCVAACFAFWLLIHSEKYRIPKYVILEEGILIKGKLITWTAIDRISWQTDYMSQNEKHYKLILSSITSYAKNGKQNASSFERKKIIHVNANQYRQVNAIFHERIYSHESTRNTTV